MNESTVAAGGSRSLFSSSLFVIVYRTLVIPKEEEGEEVKETEKVDMKEGWVTKQLVRTPNERVTFNVSQFSETLNE